MPPSSRTTSPSAGAASGPGPAEPLDEAERSNLAGVARAALRAAAADLAPPPLPPALPPRLLRPAGVFVTLYAPELRGCIGSVVPEPLAALTTRMASAAARRDPRFPPLRLEEIGGVEIEISVLSAAVVVPATEIDPDRHGVVLERDERRAVFLPQVARRYGWDRARLLAELSEKAGLAGGAWHEPGVVLRAFTTITVRTPA